jgi:hypothetical protein
MVGLSPTILFNASHQNSNMAITIAKIWRGEKGEERRAKGEERRARSEGRVSGSLSNKEIGSK